MDLLYTDAERAFRDELRGWLHDVLPSVGHKPDMSDFPALREYDLAWQRTLYDAGYAGINWAREFGGRGATPTEQLIFIEETERARAPYVGCNFVGLLHAGPTLIMEATDEQRAFHLPAILRGEHPWCQGFSEPNAGSDLASLQTRAYRDGDYYVVSGQKIWTSYAQIADYCELLVRTNADAPKHRGISWLIMPMDSPGLEVRPIRTAHGDSEFSEMFLDDVRIPVANRVGAENDGWRVAMVTFSFERGTAFTSDVISSAQDLRDLADIAKKVLRKGSSAWEDAEIRREIGRLQADYDAMWALTKRNVSQAQRTGIVGPGGSVFKLFLADVQKRATALAYKLLGRMTTAYADLGEMTEVDFVGDRVYALTLSIAAGTSQIQRNIIGERVLGLPKER